MVASRSRTGASVAARRWDCEAPRGLRRALGHDQRSDYSAAGSGVTITTRVSVISRRGSRIASVCQGPCWLPAALGQGVR
jgi:hypothetical protein